MHLCLFDDNKSHKNITASTPNWYMHLTRKYEFDSRDKPPTWGWGGDNLRENVPITIHKTKWELTLFLEIPYSTGDFLETPKSDLPKRSLDAIL